MAAAWLARLALLALCGLCQCQANRGPAATATVTKAPIFLPGYDADAWSALRGSILATNATASETTFTIFCPAQTPPACGLSLEFPFVIAEGPGMLRFHGTYTSTRIANLECRLGGTTTATCSGYSSYASGYTDGRLTGPTEVSWTSTLSRASVTWAELTLADKPDATDNSLDATATAPTVPSSELYPSATGQGAGAGVGVDRWLAAVVVAAGLLL